MTQPDIFLSYNREDALPFQKLDGHPRYIALIRRLELARKPVA